MAIVTREGPSSPFLKSLERNMFHFEESHIGKVILLIIIYSKKQVPILLKEKLRLEVWYKGCVCQQWMRKSWTVNLTFGMWHNGRSCVQWWTMFAEPHLKLNNVYGWVRVPSKSISENRFRPFELTHNWTYSFRNPKSDPTRPASPTVCSVLTVFGRVILFCSVLLLTWVS